MDNVRRIQVITPPAEHAITLAQLKSQLRISHTEDDAWLTSIIPSITMAIEDYTGLCLITQTLAQWMDHWPWSSSGAWWDGVIEAPAMVAFPSSSIEILKRPVQSLTSITTYDDTDTAAVVSASTFMLDNVDQFQPARITLRRGAVWPVALRTSNAIKIQFVAGFGAASAVPADIKLAGWMIGGFMYVNRGDCGGAGDCIGPCGANRILDSYRLMNR